MTQKLGVERIRGRTVLLRTHPFANLTFTAVQMISPARGRRFKGSAHKFYARLQDTHTEKYTMNGSQSSGTSDEYDLAFTTASSQR
jgi:hypothetical protein